MHNTARNTKSKTQKKGERERKRDLDKGIAESFIFDLIKILDIA